MINRLHTHADFQEIAELRWYLKTEDLSSGEVPDRARFIENYTAHLRAQDETGQTSHWVLDTPQGVQGVATVRKIAKETSLDGMGGAWGYLTNVFLTPALRNQGRGTALLSDLVNWAREEGLEFLLVWPSDRSRTLYIRAGFAGADDPLLLEFE